MRLLALWFVAATATSAADVPPTMPFPGLDAIYPELETLYLDLHQSPELSWHEEKTAAKMAARLRQLGFEVTTGVAKNGVVGVLRNGKGPTVLLRTELDALPIQEKTGLPFASKVTAKSDTGEVIPVMHACGHDVHMTGWIGAATLLARSKERWRGTLVFVAQPAEEVVGGAASMLADGLYTRFPKPDFAVAVHDRPEIASGQVAITPGYALANSSTVYIVVHGRGGHGAEPHRTIDPVVIAARTVVALQTIVAREIDPADPAVVTVGSMHAGTKENIIPDTAELKITVRSYRDEVQMHLLAAIERIAKAEAMAAGAPKEPTVTVLPAAAHATYNDPALSKRLRAALTRVLGSENIVEFHPIMGAEDFSEFGRAGVPAVLVWVGATDGARLREARASGTTLPGLHTAGFAPDRERTLRTATAVLTSSALELLGTP